MKRNLLILLSLLILCCSLLLEGCLPENFLPLPPGIFTTSSSPATPEKPTPTPLLTDEEGGYYYAQLSEQAKAIYSAIYRNSQKTDGISIAFSEPITATYLDGEDKESFNERIREKVLLIIQPAMDALAYDHPEIDWIRVGGDNASTFNFSTRSDGNGISLYEMTFYMVCEERDGGVTTHSRRLTEAAEALCVEGNSRYEMLLSIQRAICDATVYRTDAAYAHDAAGVLLAGEAVCDGYAKSFKMLCDLYDIPCIIVSGEAIQGDEAEAHAWNYVQMEDGYWYAVDTTWDDKENGKVTQNYFLVGSLSAPRPAAKMFSETHRPDGFFSPLDYEPFVFPTLAPMRYFPSFT